MHGIDEIDFRALAAFPILLIPQQDFRTGISHSDPECLLRGKVECSQI
jgi:hypothetical protein